MPTDDQKAVMQLNPNSNCKNKNRQLICTFSSPHSISSNSLYLMASYFPSHFRNSVLCTILVWSRSLKQICKIIFITLYPPEASKGKKFTNSQVLTFFFWSKLICYLIVITYKSQEDLLHYYIAFSNFKSVPSIEFSSWQYGNTEDIYRS